MTCAALRPTKTVQCLEGHPALLEKKESVILMKIREEEGGGKKRRGRGWCAAERTRHLASS